ncbi:hypothetical protein WJX77_002825 [Trebouxia sp. C0004]
MVKLVDTATPSIYLTKLAKYVVLTEAAEPDDNTLLVYPTVAFHDVATDVPSLTLGQHTAELVSVRKLLDLPVERESTPARVESDEEESEEKEEELAEHEVRKMERNLVKWTRGVINSFRAVHTCNYGKAVSKADNQRLSDMEDELVHEFCADGCMGHAACMLLYAAVRFMHASLAVAYGLQQSSQLLKDQMKQKASEAMAAAKQECEGTEVTLTDLFQAWTPKHIESQLIAHFTVLPKRKGTWQRHRKPSVQLAHSSVHNMLSSSLATRAYM